MSIPTSAASHTWPTSSQPACASRNRDSASGPDSRAAIPARRPVRTRATRRPRVCFEGSEVVPCVADAACPEVHVSARGLEGDRLGGRPLGPIADEHGPGRRDGLEPRRGVHEVACDHALVGRAERHGGLTGQDAGPGHDPGADGTDRVDQLEAGPHGAFGIVLLGGGRPPDGHDRVADELLDGAAVPSDHLGRQVEVRRQQLPHLLAVAALRHRREPDQVGEEDRHQATLRNGRACGGGSRVGAVSWRRRGRRPSRRGNGVLVQEPAALPAEALARLVDRPTGRAAGGQGGPARCAELPLASVLGSTARADHVLDLPHPGCGSSVADVWGGGAAIGDGPPARRSGLGRSEPRNAIRCGLGRWRASRSGRTAIPGGQRPNWQTPCATAMGEQPHDRVGARAAQGAGRPRRGRE